MLDGVLGRGLTYRQAFTGHSNTLHINGIEAEACAESKEQIDDF